MISTQRANRRRRFLPWGATIIVAATIGVIGFDVLRQVRANALTRFVPVVVLTSSSREEDVVQSYALGANSYVSKPVNHTEYEGLVSCLATYWLQLNRSSQT